MAAFPPFHDKTTIGYLFNPDATAINNIIVVVNNDFCDSTFETNEAEKPKKKEPNNFIEDRKKRKLQRWQR
jgi:inosine-uridine nucleoside N-ribohydrolase